MAAEPAASDFSPKWSASQPKSDVASSLKQAMAALQAATLQNPRNEELALLTGIVASYAYNLDVPGAESAATQALHQAASLAPDDPRPIARLGHFLCESAQIQQGMATLLAAENRFASSSLSADFWSNYLMCAYEAAMPQHARRAAARLAALRPLNATESLAAGEAKAMLIQPDASQSFSPGDVWQSHPLPGGGWRYSSDACGLELPTDPSWQWAFYPLEQNTCRLESSPDPLPGKTGPVRVHILVIAQASRPGLSLAGFAADFAARFHARPAPVLVCPSSYCLAYEIPPSHTAISAEAGEAGYLTVFRTHAPEYPGLIYEEPNSLPDSSSSGVSYHRPLPHPGRIAANMDYVVLLDAAGSVLQPALALYRKLLQGLVVDGSAAAH